MFQRKPRRFRRHSNSGGFTPRGDGGSQNRSRSNLYSSNQARSKFRNTLSAEKLLEKYNTLAKEAMSSGDRTLAENYLQHADHFMRTIEDRNRNRIQGSSAIVLKASGSSTIAEKTPDSKNQPPSNGNIKLETEVKK